MAKTLIDIDEQLLAQAQRILDTDTKRSTVNGALREVVRRHAAEQFLNLATGGAFDTPAGRQR